MCRIYRDEIAIVPNQDHPRGRWPGLYGLWLLLLFGALAVGCKAAEPAPCGGQCQPGYTCVDGQYCLKAQECQAGQTACGSQCVDLQSNEAHCGGCDKACKEGQTCSGGSCQEGPSCEGSTSSCGSKCVDLKNDGSHCGGCDKACGKGEVCIDGGCVSECPAGESGCGNACVDLQTHDQHCGSCGNACGSGFSCVDGSCQCSNGTVSCHGACVDTDTDDKHCGGCDKACKEGQTCSGGSCTCLEQKSLCGSKCVDTQSDKSHCGACGSLCNDNEACNQGKCVVERCTAGQTKCDGKCTDTQSNNTHCGACNNACPAGQLCISGSCACTGGKKLCAGACVDTSTDQDHCGACGAACTSGKTCVGGRCACASGQRLCDGACTNTQSDKDHCGACGNACPTGKSCIQGVCACPQGSSLCNGKCVDLQSDKANCGLCDARCSGTAVCNAGTCGCPPNTRLCNATCADLQTHKDHCGACSNACRSDQVCSGGSCACPSGKVECNGACVDTSSDSDHCGACGNSCAAGESCSSGSCACQAPYVTCGTSCVLLSTDAKHCGACNKACNAGEVCAHSTCRQQWGQSIASTGRAHYITTDAAGNAYTVGYLHTSNGGFGLSSFPRFFKGVFVTKTSKAGVNTWVARLSNKAAYGRGIAVHSSGNIYVSGYFQSGLTVGSTTVKSVGFTDVFIAKLDKDGKWLWIRSLGGPDFDSTERIVVDSNEDVYVSLNFTRSIKVGTTTYNAVGNVDNLLVKYDKDGTLKGALHIPSTGKHDQITALQVDKSDNLYVGASLSGTATVGQTQLSGAKVYLLKLNSSFALSWYSLLKADKPMSLGEIQVTSSGEVYVAGGFQGTLSWGSGANDSAKSAGGSDVYFARLDSKGAIQWVKTYGGAHDEKATSLTLNAQGDIFIGGGFANSLQLGAFTAKSAGSDDVFVAALDGTGAILWLNAGGSSGRDSIYALASHGGDYFYVGEAGGKLSFAPSSWVGTVGMAIAKNLP